MSTNNKRKVIFKDAKVKGESYKRPLGRSNLSNSQKSSRKLSETSNKSEQVHITIGDESNSIIISYASFDDNIKSLVQYSSSLDALSQYSNCTINNNILSATGSKLTYSQLLYVNGGLLNPSIGTPDETAANIISLQDTSHWAYDKITGEHYANYDKVTQVQSGFGLYSNPYMCYDSPYIHTILLTNLKPGVKYYYTVDGGGQIYDFTYPYTPTATPINPLTNTIYTYSDPPPTTPTHTFGNRTYPFSLGLTCDLGQTLVSEASIHALLFLHPDAVLLAGDLSYADGWAPLWDRFGRLIEPLAAYIPLLTTGGKLYNSRVYIPKLACCVYAILYYTDCICLFHACIMHDINDNYYTKSI